MKNIFIKTVSFLSFLMLFNCQEENKSFGPINAPSNLNVTAEVIGKTGTTPFGDGSGLVAFSATAANAISYKYIYSDGTAVIAPSGIYSKRFTQPGINVYSVTVIASGTGGLSTTTTFDITVKSDFKDDEAVALLTGGSEKVWYWAASELGHLGEGLNSSDNTTNFYPNEYQSDPFNTNTPCLYDDEMTFKLVGNQLTYTLDNKGTSLINREFLSVVGQPNSHQYVDACYGFTGPEATGVKNVTLSPSESLANPLKKRGTVLNFSDNGFMGFYLGKSAYEIMSITSNKLVVRVVQEAYTPNGAPHSSAWYQTFTTIKPLQDPITNYTNLTFADEFNVDGAPDPTKWSYDIGAGGWGNNEKQYYTSSSNNVIVQGGNLKITAKAEIFNSSNYTSARLKSENKYAFKYGKVEVRAKLPTGNGTWPAIWMLGQNYATNTWPSCGEIDMMEHNGNVPNIIHGSLHYPGRSGGNAFTNTLTIANASSEFHIYKTIWTPNSIKFYVDDILYNSFQNNDTFPFNKDFFMIFNVAMGGNFVGSIDSNFVQSSMEIDYVRVYQ